LEGRTAHYLARLHLSAEDQAALDAAHRALAEARGELDRLYEGACGRRGCDVERGA
jgi:hypothetical protein